jgi:hypothetical protein
VRVVVGSQLVGIVCKLRKSSCRWMANRVGVKKELKIQVPVQVVQESKARCNLGFGVWGSVHSVPRFSLAFSNIR